MIRHKSRIVYGTLFLCGCALMSILVNLNNTKPQNVTENSNNTESKNVTENSNITITQNVTVNANSESYINTTSKLILSITDPKIYNKNLRPFLGEKALEVEVRIWVTDIISVSDYTNDFAVNMHVYQHWDDPRLKFTGSANLTHLMLVRDFASLIWLPDTHILNSKSLTLQLSDSTLTSAKIRVYTSGHVSYRNSITSTVNCPMDLEYFPVDQHICKLVLSSYSYDNKNVKLHWNLRILPVTIIPNISLSTFTLTSIDTSHDKIIAGHYDALNCAFHFKRNLGYYINQIYVPSFIIVVISWIPFWLNRADHYARVGLGVTTVLTITTMVISTNESLPKTSYIKAIDVYLFVCFLMVFLAMVEFAIIGFFESGQREMVKNKKPMKGKLNGTKVNGKLKAKSKTNKRNTAWIDKVSRVIFPVVFITFNLVYVGGLFYISNYFYSHLDKDFNDIRDLYFFR